MDVASEIILQLVYNQPHLALLSNDSQEVIARPERDAIRRRLSQSLSAGIISKGDFTAHNKVHLKSLNLLLDDQEDQLVSYEDCTCTQNYDNKLSKGARNIIDRTISTKGYVS